MRARRQACWACFYQVMRTLDRMLTLAIADSSDDPAYRAALLGARLFMTVTWVRAPAHSTPCAPRVHGRLPGECARRGRQSPPCGAWASSRGACWSLACAAKIAGDCVTESSGDCAAKFAGDCVTESSGDCATGCAGDCGTEPVRDAAPLTMGAPRPSLRERRHVPCYVPHVTRDVTLLTQRGT